MENGIKLQAQCQIELDNDTGNFTVTGASGVKKVSAVPGNASTISVYLQNAIDNSNTVTVTGAGGSAVDYKLQSDVDGQFIALGWSAARPKKIGVLVTFTQLSTPLTGSIGAPPGPG